MKPTSALVMAILSSLAPAVAAIAADSGGAPADPAPSDMAAALEAARGPQPPQFRLSVHRTDEAGQRSLEVFPSGVGIWNRRDQVTLPPELRVSILQILRERGFADMAPSYGGKSKPGLTEAALRITCRVALDLDGVEKSSMQQAEGEQSAELAALADALLDRVEPLAAEGVTAESLEDGLHKLAQGQLAAETFELRLVWLPADGEGEILTLRDGFESRKAYAPGRRIGEAEVSDIRGEHFTAVINALIEADVAALPVNLWSADQVELEVAVLGHRTAIIARDFSRLAADEPDTARRRFEQLLAVLRDDG